MLASFASSKAIVEQPQKTIQITSQRDLFAEHPCSSPPACCRWRRYRTNYIRFLSLTRVVVLVRVPKRRGYGPLDPALLIVGHIGQQVRPGQHLDNVHAREIRRGVVALDDVLRVQERQNDRFQVKAYAIRLRGVSMRAR